MIQISSTFSSPSNPHPGDAALRTAAQELEVNFLTSMLGSAGFGKPSQEFGGGPGEDQFASFLRRSHAEQMVAVGGIGLAEHLFRSLSTGITNDA